MTSGPPPRADASSPRPVGAGRPRLRGATSWVIVRVTGIVLAVLVVGHFALTHIVTDVADTDASFVAARWGSALFVAWDATMLVAAVVHGGIGVWAALTEYTEGDGWRRAWGVVVWALGAVMVAGGVVTLVVAVGRP